MSTIFNDLTTLFKSANPAKERLLGLGGTLNGLIKVKLGRPMLKILVLLIPVIGLKSNLSLIKVLITYLRFVHELYCGSGMRFTVIYLKACFVLLQQSLGGQCLPDVGPFGARVSRTRGGLPRAIPSLHRERIRKGEKLIVRLWLSLFSLYRILDIPGTVKTSTITDPSTMKKGPGTAARNIFNFVPEFWFWILNRGRCDPKRVPLLDQPLIGEPERSYQLHERRQLRFELLKAKPVLLSKSAPVLSDAAFVAKLASTSPLSILLTARVWTAFYQNSDPLAIAFWKYCTDTKNTWIIQMIEICSRGVIDPRTNRLGKKRDGSLIDVSKELIAKIFANPKKRWPVKLLNECYRGFLGKLATKKEAAGKIRVFAMVDPFTQWLMRPLHNALFYVLGTIDQDGTHDQVRPLDRLVKRRRDLIRENRAPGALLIKKKRTGGRYLRSVYGLYSFDLTAATDRLPLVIQQALLIPLLGPDLARAWGTILTGRDYYMSVLEDGVPALKPHRYAVGQPMGALSSWAMLALSHHAIVQYAWKQICNEAGRKWTWYPDYAVLGDDIVIMGPDVARVYCELMDSLGVTLSKHKCLESVNGTCLEFAKRTYLRGEDVSAVSLTELLVSRRNLSAGLELMKKYNMSLGAYIRFQGYGYKSLGSLTKRLWSMPARLRNYIVAYHYQSQPSDSSILSWLALRSTRSVYKITDSVIASVKASLLEVDRVEILARLDRLYTLLCPEGPPSPGDRGQTVVHKGIPIRPPHHPGIRGIPRDVIWFMNDKIYMVPFMKAVVAVENLRTEVEGINLESFDQVGTLWSALQAIEDQIGAIPDVLHYTSPPSDKLPKEGMRVVNVWSRLSRPFRSTTKE
jgi:hypothetical protein